MTSFGPLILMRKSGRWSDFLGFHLAIRMPEHDSKNHRTDSLGQGVGTTSRPTESVPQRLGPENLSF